MLEAFDVDYIALNNKELASRSGLSKATVSRLSSTLQAHGLLDFDPVERKYCLASGTLTLGYPLLAGLGIRRKVRMGMRQLADELGGSVSLGMRDRTRMIYVETCRAHSPIDFSPDVGAALPMLPTAMGRAWLAAAPDGRRREVLESIRAAEPDEWAGGHSCITPALKHFRTHGYCFSHAEWLADVHAVAVPLHPPEAVEPLVINCGVPGREFGAGELAAKVAPRLIALARSIEEQWHVSTEQRDPNQFLENHHDEIAYGHTLSRGLEMLQCFRPGETVLSHAELKRRLRLPGSTVVRLTYTLMQLGYLRHGPGGSGYQLGAATVALGYPLLVNMRVRQVARPGMMALSDQVGGAVSLGFRHRSGMVYVESAWRGDGRLLPPDTGTLLPMLSTAMGRAWLAQASESQRQSMLNRIRLQDPLAYARYAVSVEQSKKDLDRKGYCSTRGDFRKDVYAFAVPFSNSVDGLQFIMNCGMLASHFSFTEAERRVSGPLRELVREVEKAMAVLSGKPRG